MHDDWHLDRVVSAIRLAAQARGDTAVADARAAAICRQQGRERLVARKCKRDEEEAERRQEEEAVISGLQVELRALRDHGPGMSLLTAVEFITSDPAHRVALYSRCIPEDRSIQPGGVAQDDACLLKIASSVDKDLTFLQRRAAAEGFSGSGRMKRDHGQGRVHGGFGHGSLPVTRPTAH
jgi:hypothetical protein